MTELTEKLLEYKADKLPHCELLNLIRQFVYDFPSKLGRIYADHSGSFLIFMDDKLKQLIIRFEYRDVPFEAYLYTTLRLQFITYLKQMNKEHSMHLLFAQKEYATELDIHTLHEDIAEVLAPDDPVTKLIQTLISEQGKKHARKSFNKRLWWFLLKRSPVFTDIDYLHIGVLLGFKKNEVLNTLQSLTSEKTRLQQKLSLCQERANYCFHKIKTFEYTIKYKLLTENERLRNIHLLKVYKTRLGNFNNSSKEKYFISNKVLSSQMGIAKGTLDSGIFLLKKELLSIKKRRNYEKLFSIS